MTEVYSSGLISQSFWFVEMKKMILLHAGGMSESEIKNTCIEKNLFGAAKEYRAKRMYRYLYNRLKQLDQSLVDIFCTSDLETQKLINLIAIVNDDRLFFEFLYEVYRDKVILGTKVLTISDGRNFMSNKESQSAEVRQWTESTKKRLPSLYLNFMTDANLLSYSGKERIITPPILDTALEQYFDTRGNKSIYKAITGVK